MLPDSINLIALVDSLVDALMTISVTLEDELKAIRHQMVEMDTSILAIAAEISET